MIETVRTLSRRLAGIACVLLLGGLAACGGGGGGGESPDTGSGVAGAPYFPLGAGARWRYDDAGTRWEVIVNGTTVIDGNTATVVSNSDGTTSTDSYYVVSDAGVSLVPGPNSDAFTRSIGRLELVRFPLRTGSSFVALDKALPAVQDFDGDGRADPVTQRIEVTVVGFETVTTPAGSFADSVHLRTVATFVATASSTNQRVTVTLTANEWYAPGVGQVRGTYRTTSPTSDETTRLQLLTYKVGSLSGNAGEPAPTVTSFTPSAGSPVAAGSTVVLGFSTEIDPASVPASRLVVRGPSGAALPGQLAWADPRTLRFTPAAPLADGTHTVQLAAGTADLFGVAMTAGSEWNFTVDATAPTVATLTPAAGSLSASGLITVRFSEPMDRNGPVPALTVTGPGNAPFAGFASWQDERTLAFVSQGVLASGTYTVTLAAGAADTTGNPAAAGTQWQFSIDAAGPTLVSTTPAQGAVEVPLTQTVRLTFDEPVAAASVTPGAVRLLRNGTAVPASLRLEGNSVLLVPDAPLLNGATYRLLVDQTLADARGNTLLQPVDQTFVTDGGRFALPVQLPALNSDTVEQLALGDLDGNGTADLVVSQTDINILSASHRRISRQTDGTLAPVAVNLPFTCTVSSIAISDLTADGRNDVAFDSGTCGVQWITQDSNGTFTQVGLIGTGGFSPPGTQATLRAITLAGTSRRGLVSTSAGPLRLWRPTGTIGYQAAEVLFSTPPASLKLAVGDVNGDGREDVVAVGNLGSNRGIVVALQRADASFDVQTQDFVSASDPIAIADLDGDGRLDVVMGSTTPGLLVLRQGAAGTLGAPERVVLPSTVRALQVLDFDGDGRTDIVALIAGATVDEWARVRVMLLQPGGGYLTSDPFDFADPLVLPRTSAFLVADFSGDGRPDFLIGQQLLVQKAGAAAPQAARPQAQRTSAAPARRPGALRLPALPAR